MQIWVMICFDFAELCEVQLGHFWAYINVRFRGRQWINNVGSTPLCPMLTEQQMKIENLYLCWLWKYLTQIIAGAKKFPKVDPTYSFPHSFTVVFNTSSPLQDQTKPGFLVQECRVSQPAVHPDRLLASPARAVNSQICWVKEARCRRRWSSQREANWRANCKGEDSSDC